jgi:hypothetical protein
MARVIHNKKFRFDEFIIPQLVIVIFELSAESRAIMGCSINIFSL